MGNFWSDVYVSNGKTLETHLNKVDTCKKAVSETRNMIQEVIGIVNNVSNWDRTTDYQKYKLYPGQVIFYRNVMGRYNNIHPGIYVYDGLVLELASGPKACKKEANFVTSFMGFNTLREFKRCGKNKRCSHVWKISTGKENQKNTMIAILRRAKKAVGPCDFRVFSRNCQHITYEVGFGKPEIPKDAQFIQITRGKV